MNQQQKKYAAERIFNIEQSKLALLTNECTTDPTYLSSEDMYDLIKNGDVELRNKNDIKHSSTIRTFFNFDSHETNRYFDRSVYNTKSTVILKKSKEIKDKIMLGDAVEALELISEFENL